MGMVQCDYKGLGQVAGKRIVPHVLRMCEACMSIAAVSKRMSSDLLEASTCTSTFKGVPRGCVSYGSTPTQLCLCTCCMQQLAPCPYGKSSEGKNKLKRF
jgi:hypothetical protein